MKDSYDNKYYRRVWEVSNKLRGKMSVEDFRDVFLGLLFYRIISEQIERLNNLYFEEFNGAINIKENLNYKLLEFQQDKIGFSIKEEALYSKILEYCCKEEYYTLDILRKTLYEVSNQFQDSRYSIFEFVLSSIEKLDSNIFKRNKTLCEILYLIDSAFREIIQDYEVDFGIIFNSFIEVISHRSGKKLDNICSPNSFSELLAELITSLKSDIRSVYDPTFGHGLLALSLINEKRDVKIYGHEINPSIYNIARMNLIINNHSCYGLALGNSLEIRRNNLERYDVVVGHPPFNLRWDNSEWFYNGNYRCIPPKSSADYAFVIKMLEQLDNDGVMAIVLPHGVLFRENNAEKAIRKDLIKNNFLDAVIGLPKNIMYETNIPLCLLVFRKNRLDNKIVFIDASSNFRDANMKLSLLNENLKKIKSTYLNRVIKQGYSEIVSTNDIEELDYNLSIHKYIDVFRTDMLMKNYNFKKYRLEVISEICRYKGYEDENSLILRANNPKVIDNYKELIGNNSNYISISPKEEFLSVEYLKYFFSTHISKALFDSISVGNITRISLRELKDLEIPLPEKNEQIKIVNSQNQIDDTINELIEYRDRLVNNPDQVDDLTFKLKELRSALVINNRIDSIKKEISYGETLYIEFKKDFSSCEEKIIKTLYAFFNTDGGKLYIGVEDSGEIIGLDESEEFKDTDDLVLKFSNRFRDKVPEYLTYADIEVLIIDNKTVLLLKCIKAKKPVFRRKNGKSEFYVRKFASSQSMNDVEEVLRYVDSHFE